MGDTGRPTKYEEELNDYVYKLALGGCTDEQLAEHLGVCKSTLTNWKNEYPEFLASIKKGKDFYDTHRVENALLKRALGTTVKETRINGGGEDGDEKKPAATETTKELPPETAACIFWLKNRNPDRWRDKQEATDTSEGLVDALYILADKLPS